MDETPLIGLTKRTKGVRPRIYISSGVHGDEPAPPLALLHLLESGCFEAEVDWFLVPMLNPSGFRKSHRTNTSGTDLNRDYQNPVSTEVISHVSWLERQPRFDLALCVHEDWESTGFYLYELNPQKSPSLGPAIREAASRQMPIDSSEIIDGRPIDDVGIIRPESDPKLRDQWPEAIYLREHHTDLCFTFETSSAFPLHQRIDTHGGAIRCAINLLRV